VTTWHATDEELVAHRYGDGEPGAAERIEAHLSACPGCQERWQDFAETLALVDAAATPEPDAEFEHRIWARVQASASSRRSRWSARPVAWVAAWAAMVSIAAGAAYVASRSLSAARGPATAAARAAVPDGLVPSAASLHARERVLRSAVTDHLSQTEVLLVELLNAPAAEPAELDFARASADELLASGRLYRQTAEKTGDAQVTDVLDDLEGVLVEVARSPRTVAPREVAAWRTQIHSGALLFKVRAVSQDIHDRQQALMTESE
jgi:hypothetical protein